MTTPLTRRKYLTLSTAGLVLAAGAAASGSLFFSKDAAAHSVEVWKSPSCGCCDGWVGHLRDNNLDVVVHDLNDVSAVKTEMGIPEELWSCHTARIDGHLLEGHVPASDILALLEGDNPALGLAVPGMPASSPGMDMPGEPFETISFDAKGTQRIFNRHPG